MLTVHIRIRNLITSGGLNPSWIEEIRHITVGTFVGRLLQKRGQLWVVPTIASGLKAVASH